MYVPASYLITVDRQSQLLCPARIFYPEIFVVHEESQQICIVD